MAGNNKVFTVYKVTNVLLSTIELFICHCFILKGALIVGLFVCLFGIKCLENPPNECFDSIH